MERFDLDNKIDFATLGVDYQMPTPLPFFGQFYLILYFLAPSFVNKFILNCFAALAAQMNVWF